MFLWSLCSSVRSPGESCIAFPLSAHFLISQYNLSQGTDLVCVTLNNQYSICFWLILFRDGNITLLRVSVSGPYFNPLSYGRLYQRSWPTPGKRSIVLNAVYSILATLGKFSVKSRTHKHFYSHLLIYLLLYQNVKWICLPIRHNC